MIHISQVPTYLFRLLTLTVVTAPTLMAQEPLWFQKSKLAPVTKQSTSGPLWFNVQETKSESPAPQSSGKLWFQSAPDKTVTQAKPKSSADVTIPWTSWSSATTPVTPALQNAPESKEVIKPEFAPAQVKSAAQVAPKAEFVSAQVILAVQVSPENELISAQNVPAAPESPTQNPPVAQVLPIPHEILKAEVVAANQIATGAQILPAAQVTPSGLTATEPQSPTTRTDRATTVAPESIAGPDSVPSTWIRNAVLAKRENPNKDSGELLVDGQKTSARANNKRALESTLTDIKLSSLTLKSGEVETPQSPLYLKPTPLAIVTLQPPKLDRADLIRQLVADKNDQGLVVNVEFIDITEQTVSNVDDANARSEGEEIAAETDADSKTSKFSTAEMIGPLEDTNDLFSRLQISDRYESYAAHVPANRTREEDFLAQSPWPFDTYTWISPVFYYKPLYFEQPNLERYGLGTKRWLQPAASSIHFFGTIPLLPYKVLTQHPCEKYYTLGNNRPGDCVPFQRATILGQSHVGEILYYWIPGSGY